MGIRALNFPISLNIIKHTNLFADISHSKYLCGKKSHIYVCGVCVRARAGGWGCACMCVCVGVHVCVCEILQSKKNLK
jgi:hypothetical protein